MTIKNGLPHYVVKMIDCDPPQVKRASCCVLHLNAITNERKAFSVHSDLQKRAKKI